MVQEGTKKFPSNFLFGSAVSAFQVEGNFSGERKTDWDILRLTQGNGPNWWEENYYSDLETLASLGLNAQRIGFEWARIIPERKTINLLSIKKYREIIDFIKKLGMEPLVTLNHFTLPNWVSKEGGWENPAIKRNFKYFTEVIADHFGDINYWVTINEPTQLVSMGYLIGKWPPFRKNDYLSSALVLQNMISAQNDAYDVIKKDIPQSSVGLAHAIHSFRPKSKDSYFDKKITKIINMLFADSVIHLTKENTDFIGLNFYHGYYLKFVPFNLSIKMSKKSVDVAEKIPLAKIEMPKSILSDTRWPIVPDFFLDTLQRIGKNFQKPIVITENGIADSEDKYRGLYLLTHLLAVHEAKKRKVDIKGYFYWSSIDTEEWLEGFKYKFGLIGCDEKTGERSLRKSSRLYGDIARNGFLDLQKLIDEHIPIDQKEETEKIISRIYRCC